MGQSNDVIQEIHGDFDTVYNELKRRYTTGENELLAYLETTRVPDLTIDETFKLYAKLRYEIDEDLVVRIMYAEGQVVDESRNQTYRMGYWFENAGDICGK